MLDGWYCRSLAKEQTSLSPQQQNQPDMNDDSDSNSHNNCDDIQQRNNNTNNNNAGVDYKAQYRYLKRKLKFLIYENEFFQDALRSNQRRLLKISRDKAFLLDRLLQYEKPENSSSDNDETEESSEDEMQKETKKKKMEQTINNSSTSAGGVSGSGSTRGRKKKLPQASTATNEQIINAEKPIVTTHMGMAFQAPHQHELSSAEIERQLSKRPYIDMMPERAPATVPVEMFSNEPSLDSEVNEQIIDGTSGHVAAEECVPMQYNN